VTKQQKIGATILIGLLVSGIIFKFYAPFHAFAWLLLVFFAVVVESGWLKKLKATDRLARFWSFPSNQKTNKYPTIEDIRRKYPKKLSQDQLCVQARIKDEAEAKRKQDIINRNIREVRASQEEQSTKSRYSNPKYKKLLTMLNGDVETSDRLISAYGIDRAISDLIRDRQ